MFHEGSATRFARFPRCFMTRFPRGFREVPRRGSRGFREGSARVSARFRDEVREGSARVFRDDDAPNYSEMSRKGLQLSSTIRTTTLTTNHTQNKFGNKKLTSNQRYTKPPTIYQSTNSLLVRLPSTKPTIHDSSNDIQSPSMREQIAQIRERIVLNELF